MPAALPNRKNNVKLTPAKAVQAQAAIKNLIPGIQWPPLTAAASDQLRAAVAPILAEINKAQATAAKTATGSFVPPAPLQLAAQQANIGSNLPGIAKFLPAGTDLQTTSYANAVSTMQDTIVQIQNFIANPAGGGPGAGTLEDRAAVKNK